MSEIKHYIDLFNEFMWGYPMILLLIATHVYLTLKLKFIQKYLFKAIKLSVKKDESAGMVSNFAALSVSLAASIGTGSILGITTAIAIGGPGAIFWLIIFGFFGMATKYAECMLAVQYRTRNEKGEYVGGPMYIMQNILNMKWLAVVFAVSGLFMAISGGGMLQVNAIGDVLYDAYKIPPIYIGIAIAALISLVIFGGVKSIADACSWLVPIMGIVYLLAALYVFITHIGAVPHIIELIFKSAFSPKAAGGAFAGTGIMMAVYTGASRSVFATEAGLGSAALAAAAAKTQTPVRQGLIGSTSVFWTVFICTLTGFIVLLAGDWQSGNKFAGDLCNSAFTTIPFVGIYVCVFSLTIFSLTTIIAWAYYGEKFIEFLFGHKTVLPFRLFWIFSMLLGAWMSSQFVWSLVVTITIAMAVPNLVMIFLLRNDILKETKKYIKQEIDSI